MKQRMMALVAVVVIAVAVLAWRNRDVTDPDVLYLSGNIEFRKMDVAFKTAGRLVELLKDEGERVEVGQLLARLDPEQLRRVKERDEAGIVAARSGMAQLEQAIAMQEAAVTAELALREAEVRAARAKLAELREGARKQEIAQAKAAVADLRTRREQAARDLDRAKKLAAAEDISVAQLDQYQVRLDTAVAQLDSAEQRLALVEEGPRRTDIEMAQAQVARTEAALRLAETQRLEIARKREDRNVRRAEMQRSEANVRVIETQLDDTAARSPLTGVVLVRSADPGEVVAAGTPVLTLGEIDKPWFRGYVPQEKLGRVKLGLPVVVRSDSYPGKTYAGRISFIASEAEFTPKQIQTREERVKLVYRIKVEVENPRQELKLNMPVDAEIRLQ